MELSTLKAVLAKGDKHGSGIRQMMSDLKICDLSNVTQEQAEWWLAKKEGDKNDNDNGNEN